MWRNRTCRKKFFCFLMQDFFKGNIKKGKFIKEKEKTALLPVRAGTPDNYYALLCIRPAWSAHIPGQWDYIIKTVFMEQLNRIELRGNVGNVRISDVGENRVARFSLATNFMYRGKDNEAVVETTWHNIVAWNGKGMPDFSSIVKGAPVYVTGRLRTSRFTGSDGVERTAYEVIASRVDVLDFQA